MITMFKMPQYILEKLQICRNKLTHTFIENCRIEIQNCFESISKLSEKMEKIGNTKWFCQQLKQEISDVMSFPIDLKKFTVNVKKIFSKLNFFSDINNSECKKLINEILAIFGNKLVNFKATHRTSIEIIKFNDGFMDNFYDPVKMCELLQQEIQNYLKEIKSKANFMEDKAIYSRLNFCCQAICKNFKSFIVENKYKKLNVLQKPYFKLINDINNSGAR